ncbi:ABC transporter permease [Dyella sp. 2RAB6]|uniref:ABC transporter permease n=1 Tax=Dyella sp. 2RAB6 TaxID=3232992 RepID=UPI003F916220
MNAVSSVTAIPVASAAREMTRGRVLGAYLQEARAECLRYLRNPGFMIPTLILPTAFYLMFGILLGHANGPEAPRYLLAAYGTFGVMSPGLFGFGVASSMERDNGLLTLKRALPMPPGAYLLGKVVMAMFAAAVVSCVLVLLATLVAHVQLSPAQMAALFATNLFGSLPFCAMGLMLGMLIKGSGAPGIVNLIYLPMAFMSGLWFPLSLMPKAVQQIALALPPYHLNQVALAAVGLGQGAVWPHVATLAGFSAVFLAIAARRLRRHG